jgi:hypothetical protein
MSAALLRQPGYLRRPLDGLPRDAFNGLEQFRAKRAPVRMKKTR